MVNATTLTRVKALLGDTGSANDALLNTLIESVSREIEAAIGYPLAQAARVEYHDLEQNDRILFLRVVPVVSVAEVKIGPSDWDFSSLTALTADDDYRLGNDGQLYLNLSVSAGFQKAKVTYTAGLGTTDAAVATAAGDLAFAADMQVCEEWRRRDNPTTVSIPTPKGAKTMEAPHRFLPRVESLLARHKRMVIQ